MWYRVSVRDVETGRDTRDGSNRAVVAARSGDAGVVIGPPPPCWAGVLAAGPRSIRRCSGGPSCVMWRRAAELLLVRHGGSPSRPKVVGVGAGRGRLGIAVRGPGLRVVAVAIAACDARLETSSITPGRPQGLWRRGSICGRGFESGVDGCCGTRAENRRRVERSGDVGAVPFQPGTRFAPEDQFESRRVTRVPEGRSASLGTVRGAEATAASAESVSMRTSMVRVFHVERCESSGRPAHRCARRVLVLWRFAPMERGFATL